MRFERCTWRQIADYFQRDTRAVVVLGATEQHADLSVCTDTLIPYHIAKRACAAEDVLLVPPLHFGISSWAAAYPGTVYLRTDTMTRVIEDITVSLCTSGCTDLVILNGHGFNRAVCPVFCDLMRGNEPLKVWFYQWYDLPSVRRLLEEWSLRPFHANFVEAFRFTMKGTSRAVQVRSKPMPNLLQSSQSNREDLADGNGPGPLVMTPTQQRRLLAVAVEEFAAILREVADRRSATVRQSAS